MNTFNAKQEKGRAILSGRLNNATLLVLIISNITSLLLAALLSNSLLGGGLGYFAALREQLSIHTLYAATGVDEVHWTITGQTSVSFDWRGPVSENIIRYGISSGNYNQSITANTPSPLPDSSGGPFWEARLTGLQESTLYYYQIGTRSEKTFRTPPPRGSSDFWIAQEADIGGSTKYPAAGPTQAQIASDNQNIAGDDRPRFVLASGDLAYGDSGSTSYVDQHFNDVMVWSETSAYMPAWGNHEDGSSADDRQNYEGRFDFPNSQDSPNAPVKGGPGEEWYWFDYGNTRFISYPEPFSGAWSDWNSKVDPIMAAAQNDPAITFIITWGHRPPYSSGSDHGSDTSIRGYMNGLRTKYSKYALNMGAHSHHYERTVPAQSGGMLHIVSGGGGATQGGLASAQPFTAFRLNHLQHLKIRITSNSIEGYSVCGPSGAGATDTCVQDSVVDSWTIAAPGSPQPVNQAPNGIINSPSGATTITAGQSVSFAGTGSDPDATMPLSFLWSFSGGASASTVEDPGAVVFNTPGTYAVALTVTDALGLADLTPDTRTITVTSIGDTTPPSTSITAPTAGATVSGSVTVSAGASDPESGISGVQFKVDGANLGAEDTTSPYSVSWDTTSASNGSHALTAVAMNGAGLTTTSSPVTVSVSNAAAPGGATYYVATNGNNAGTGSLSNPWRTVTFGISRLTAGDTLNIRGGTYYERPTASVNGTVSSPITIQSYPGEQVIIDSGGPEFKTPGNSDWELVNASLGEYRSVASFSTGQIAAYVDGIPGYYNGRVGLVPYTSAAAFRSTSEAYVDGSTPFYIGPGTFRDSDSRIHIRLAKTQDMRDVESRYGTVFPTENADPRAYGIILSNAPTTLAISGSYLTFKNITFHQALETITLSGSTHDVIFDGITAWFGNRTISVTGSGVYNITVRNSRIYGDVPLWIAWSDAKDPPAPADLWRGTSINLASGARDVTISYSHIRGGHDGLGMNTNENNVTLHHNRIENFADDCFEIEGTTDIGRIEMYENYFANCLDMLSVGQDSPAITGPVLLYRNIASFLRNPYVNRKDGINTWNGSGKYGYEYMFKQGGTNYSTGNIHYSHNTFVMLNTGSGKGMNFGRMTVPSGSTLANNVTVMVVGKINNTYPSSGSGALINGNLYWKVIPRITGNSSFDALLSSYTTVPLFSGATGYEQNGKGATAYEGINPAFSTLSFPALSSESDPNQRRFLTSSFERLAPADFLLSASSPACGAGAAIQGRMTTTLSGAIVEPLKDSRGFDNDLGAIPCGTLASEYDIFPFVVSATPQPPASDTTAPVISAVVAANITSSSAAISWITNENSDRQVEFGLSTSYGQTTVIDTTRSMSHSVSITNLSPSTLYHYRVRSRDSSGNLAISGDATFVTLAAASSDTLPPTGIGNASPANSATGVAINPSLTVLTASDATTPVEYYFELYAGATCSGSLVQTRNYFTSTIWNPNTLAHNTSYAWRVRARDSAVPVNESGFSACTSFTTTAPADTTSPVRSNGLPSGDLAVGTTSATISVMTDETATCKYGTVAGISYASLPTTFTTTGGTNHSNGVTGLSNGTTYAYYIRCQDSQGNANTTDYTVTFQVLAPGPVPTDLTPPTIYNVQSTQVGQTQATILWDTDELATSAVEYGLTTSYGTLTTTATLMIAHSKQLTGLTPNTLYNFRITSADAMNNSASSQNQTFATLSLGAQCTESWSCSDWGSCTGGTQTRTCTDANSCGTSASRPVTSQSCSTSSPSGGGGGGGSPNPPGSNPPLNTPGIPQTPGGQAPVSSGGSCTSGRNQDVINAFIAQERSLFRGVNLSLRNRLLGYILLQVEGHGEAWYLDIVSKLRYYLADGCSAYDGLRKFGLGITNVDLEKIPVGIEPRFADIDSDSDGLPDKMEEGLGTDPAEPDTDEDGYTDGTEIFSGHNPKGSGVLPINTALTNRLRGRILLQVQAKGQAWYINPKDGKRYYMKNGEAAYQIMRFLSLGVTNADLRKIEIGR